MTKLRIAFFGSPEVACGFLSRVVSSGHGVAGVVTQPDRPAGRGMKLCCSPVGSLAGELCIEQYKPASRAALHETVAALRPDLGVVVAYGRLIPEATLALARFGFLNVHFSLLPKYRGAAPVQWALINGEKVSGVTLFWLDKGMDTGPVFMRREVPVLPEDDAASLFGRLCAAGQDLLAEGLGRIASGELAREPQLGEPTYAPKLTPGDAVLDFSRPAEALLGRVRGLACGPLPRFFLDARGRRGAVQVLAASLYGGAAAGAERAGTVLAVEPGGGFVVKCGAGALVLKTLKPEGKKAMPASDFLNGLRLRPGDRLAGPEGA